MIQIGAIVAAVSAIFGVIIFLNNRDGRKFEILFKDQADIKTQISTLLTAQAIVCSERKLIVESQFASINKEIELLKRETTSMQAQHTQSMGRIEKMVGDIGTKINKSNDSVNKLTLIMVQHMSKEGSGNGGAEALIDG